MRSKDFDNLKHKPTYDKNAGLQDVTVDIDQRLIELEATVRELSDIVEQLEHWKYQNESGDFY